MERFLAGLTPQGRQRLVIGGIILPISLFTGIILSRRGTSQKSQDVAVEILARERLGMEVGVKLSRDERRRLERERLTLLVKLDKIQQQKEALGIADGPMLPDDSAAER